MRRRYWVLAGSACVISFGIGVFVGYSEAGGDLYAAFLGRDVASCPRPGDILTDKVLTHGCINPGATTVRFLPVWSCADGRKLLSEERMFGFSGARVVASEDTAKDPDYTEAYRECIGNR